MVTQRIKPPKWYVVLSVILLIWNIIGIIAFTFQITISDEALQAMPSDERQLYEDYPPWASFVYALAVFSGTLGCLGLLLGRSWTRYVFIVSLVAVVIQMFHSLVLTNTIRVYGPGSVIMPVFILIISVFLVWFAGYASKKGWIVS